MPAALANCLPVSPARTRPALIALLTNAQLRETVQQQLDQVLAKRRL